MANRELTDAKPVFEPFAQPREPFAVTARRYFVAVGVADPAPGSMYRRLGHVATDLETMTAAFGVLGYTPVKLALDTEAPPFELTREVFQSRFNQWLDQARLGPQDELAFYFSGHGHRSGLRHYLCFRGFDAQTPSRQGLSAEGLLSPITERGPTVAGRVWILLDCCMAADAAYALVSEMNQAAPTLGPTWSGRITAATGAINPSFDGCFSRTFAAAVNKGVRGATAIEKTMRETFGPGNPQVVFGNAVGAWDDTPSAPQSDAGAGSREGAAAKGAATKGAATETEPPVTRAESPATLRPRAPDEPSEPRAPSGPRRPRATMVGLAVAALLAATGTLWLRPSTDDMATIPGGALRGGLSLTEANNAFRLCQKAYGGECLSWEASIFARSVRPEGAATVAVAAFRLDRHEVSAQSFRTWLNTHPGWRYDKDSREITGGDGRPWVNLGASPFDDDERSQSAVSVSPDKARRPATGMTFFAAQRYCADRGARLPTEAEWELAARGTKSRKYPWGDEPPDDCDHTIYARGKGDLCAEKAPHPEPVASARRDVTPEGVQDLGGNVVEWTASPYEGATTDKICPPGAQCHVLRGGSYLEGLLYLASGLRSRRPDDRPMPNGGFRCARD